ncbi:MAG: demethoxyubiquinone hydroxylase family protein [Alphaproteobacteria bacterium]|nr:demethoxyubiquinone hydroxylase family protein [Alphaproteobacteria bacterium]
MRVSIKTTPRLSGFNASDKDLARMIRVDHAGEHGAVQIYAGQLAVLGHTPVGDTIRHMQAQEQDHLDTFDRLIAENGVRPTALSPVWSMAGYALGAVTALMGEKAAMACTAAVEEVIDEHYAAQAASLEKDGAANADLRNTIEKFRADEIQHRDTAIEHGAEQAPGYRVLSETIKAGCRFAIKLSERF